MNPLDRQVMHDAGMQLGARPSAGTHGNPGLGEHAMISRSTHGQRPGGCTQHIYLPHIISCIATTSQISPDPWLAVSREPCGHARWALGLSGPVHARAVGVRYFARDEQLACALDSYVLTYRRRVPGRSWSAGCSTQSPPPFISFVSTNSLHAPPRK